MATACEAGQLARSRHAARGVADAASGLGRIAPVALYAGRTAHRVHAVGDLALAADFRREPNEAGRLYAVADDVETCRHKSTLGIQQRGSGFTAAIREGQGMDGSHGNAGTRAALGLRVL